RSWPGPAPSARIRSRPRRSRSRDSCCASHAGASSSISLPSLQREIPVQIRCDKAARAHPDDTSRSFRAAAYVADNDTPRSPITPGRTIAHQVVSAARDQVDALQFAGLLARAREATAAGAHDIAALVLREALGLWRGVAYADFQDTWFGTTEAAHLGEMRLAALEARIEADLALGRHAE